MSLGHLGVYAGFTFVFFLDMVLCKVSKHPCLFQIPWAHLSPLHSGSGEREEQEQ